LSTFDCTFAEAGIAVPNVTVFVSRFYIGGCTCGLSEQCYKGVTHIHKRFIMLPHRRLLVVPGKRFFSLES